MSQFRTRVQLCLNGFAQRPEHKKQKLIRIPRDFTFAKGVIVLLTVCGVSEFLYGCGGMTFASGNSVKATSDATTLASLSKVSCGTQSLTGPQTKACSVYLTAAASSSTVVTLKSSNVALRVPSSVTVPAGAMTAGFNAVSSSVSQTVSVTITAVAGGVTRTVVISVYPAPTSAIVPSKLSCGTQSLTGPTTKACSVYLSAPVKTTTAVSLSSSSSSLTVPAQATVYAGSSTAGFTATASTVTSSKTVSLTATLNGVSQSTSIQLLAATSTSTSTYNVNLSWAAPAITGIAGYRVYRESSGSTTFQALNSALDTQTAYVDSSVQNGHTYYYRVTTIDKSGLESPPSGTISISVPN